jgi:Tol biopolymer transport system component
MWLIRKSRCIKVLTGGLGLGLLAMLMGVIPAGAEPVMSSMSVTAPVASRQADGSSHSGVLSDDGRYIAFTSVASNLVAGDNNGLADIFVRDRQLNITTRVSTSTTQAEANAGAAEPDISGNGRYIVFQSAANNLVPGDSNGVTDIFLHDRLLMTTQRVSVAATGDQALGPSRAPVISDDGRHVAYISEAANLVLGDRNGAADVFLYHVVTGKVLRVSVSTRGVEADGPALEVAISGDGRIVAFVSVASNLVTADSNAVADVFIYERLLASTVRVSFAASGLQSELPARLPQISDNGRFVAYSAEVGDGELSHVIYDLWNSRRHAAVTLAGEMVSRPAALSGNGHMLAYWAAGPAGPVWMLRDLQQASEAPLALPAADLSIDLSADGRIVLASTEILAEDILALDLRPSEGHAFTISGRITDPLGRPLAVVSVQDETGRKTRSDRFGYFWMAGLSAGDHRISPSKEGFSFEPRGLDLNLTEDLAGLEITFEHEDTLKEAELDLGMPYSNDRGCDHSNYAGCGGPFHGFAAGYCTDLVLDAYNFGAEFSIQLAIERDVRLNPQHYYYWPSARDSHDMWRYFSYAGQISYGPPYLPGDIVFFDWTEDGELDHVALISQVDEFGNPIFMFDATGVIDSNPGGLASELPWEPFHELTVRGHARWSGAYEPPVFGFPQGIEVLQMALSGADLSLRLLDGEGRAVGLTQDQLPGGDHIDLIWEDVITLIDPLGLGSDFVLEISSHGEGHIPYWFNIHRQIDGRQYGHVEVYGTIFGGETIQVPLALLLDVQDEPDLSVLFPLRQPKIRGLLFRP